jgi:DNA-binding LacI/PurR family transcriptional regulator
VLPLTLDNLVFSKISHSLRVAAAGHGLQVLPIFCDGHKDQEEQLIQELIGHLVEGIIFNSIISASRRTIREVLNKKIPVVMLERSPDAKGVDKVVWDNIAGSEIAASHFIAKGHRSLSFIGCQFGPTPDDEERFMGFKQGLGKMGIILRKNNTQLVPNYEIEQGYKAMKAIIEQSGANRPTGCYITADTLLCGALQYLYEAGAHIP